MTPTLTDSESLASSSFVKTFGLVGISLILNPIVVFFVDLLIGCFFLISYRLATIHPYPDSVKQVSTYSDKRFDLG